MTTPIQLEAKVRLSPSEQAVWDAIRRKLAVEGKNTFDSDDLHFWESN